MTNDSTDVDTSELFSWRRKRLSLCRAGTARQGCADDGSQVADLCRQAVIGFTLSLSGLGDNDLLDLSLVVASGT